MSHHHHHQHGQHLHPAKAPKRNWLFIAAGILMILAMLVYVLTLDESEVPGEPLPPAAAGQGQP